MPNTLADALSPYLRQHAGNPVNWQQWGAAPFKEAATRDVPVFVSIGYSTCHWCHVMARESFSDPGIAQLLNENFVAIKVDREEHPEVDANYMTAASAFTQNLGWPLNVFVTPQGHTFFAGTYWPPESMGGHQSFSQVLEAITDAWVHRRDLVEANAAEVAEAIRARSRRDVDGVDGGADTADTALESAVLESAVLDGAVLEGAVLDGAVDFLASMEDTEFGGFGSAPKFPVVPVIDFLLQYGSERSLSLADRTLSAMAASRLRDPVEGGFFRYSTRRDWTEPHYERMLYDNAQLLECYAALAQRVPERAEQSKATAEGIARFLLEILRLPGGGFASAQNSESIVDGALTEGDYYLLSAENRANQTSPALDDKILTGWNGLAIGALAFAGHHFGRADWVDAARESAEHLLALHVRESGELARASLDGTLSDARATLEDYGLLARGLLKLAEATGEVVWALEARKLVDACTLGAGFATPGGGDPVLAGLGIDASGESSDGALPSGLSALAGSSLVLYLLGLRQPSSEHYYRTLGIRAMERLVKVAPLQPMGFGAALAVMAALTATPTQLVVVSNDLKAELVTTSRAWFATGGVSVTVTESGAKEWAAAGFELFEGRSLQTGSPTAYLCSDFVCRLPVTEVTDLGSLMAQTQVGNQ